MNACLIEFETVNEWRTLRSTSSGAADPVQSDEALEVGDL